MNQPEQKKEPVDVKHFECGCRLLIFDKAGEETEQDLCVPHYILNAGNMLQKAGIKMLSNLKQDLEAVKKGPPKIRRGMRKPGQN